MKISVIVGLLGFALVGCAAEQKQPEKKWEVKVTKGSEPKTWVSKTDGSRQCEKDSATLKPESAMQELKNAGVMVYQARNGHDGMMHTTVCGASTGGTIDVEISRVDLPKAQSLGYRVPRVSKD